MTQLVLPVSPLKCCVLGVAALLGLCSTGVAQTVPQLLPYTTKVVAGTPTTTLPAKANPAANTPCPSGLMATDAYGDGCLATEVIFGTTGSPTGVRDAVADPRGMCFSATL